MPVLVRRIAPFRVLLTASKSAPTALLVTDVLGGNYSPELRNRPDIATTVDSA
jgi:hypothetical protein